MISLILASGRLSGRLSNSTSVRSLLRLSAGINPALLDVIEHEKSISDSVWVTVSEPVPSWWEPLSQSVNWVNVASELPSIAASCEAAMNSIEQRMDMENSELRVVFGDTLCFIRQADTVAVGSSPYAEDWTFAPIDLASSSIDVRASGEHSGVVCGGFIFKKPKLFLEKLSHSIKSFSPIEHSEPFFKAIQLYARDERAALTPVFDEKWEDFGHLTTFFDFRRNRLSGRQINSFNSRSGGQFIRKTSSRVEKLRSEALWFKNLPLGFNSYLPRVLIDQSADSYSLQYIPCLTASEKLLFGETQLVDWAWITQRFDEWFRIAKDAASFFGVVDVGDPELDWIENHFDERWGAASITLLELGLSPDEMIRLKSAYYSAVHESRNNMKSCSVVHGDLILSNVLCDESAQMFKLIDPRGGFSNSTIYGPELYDWAKLAQSIFGRYEEILARHYWLLENSYSINFYEDIDRAANYEYLRDWFRGACPHPDVAIRLAGVLLISALPFHQESKNRMMAMVAQAIELLGVRE